MPLHVDLVLCSGGKRLKNNVVPEFPRVIYVSNGGLKGGKGGFGAMLRSMGKGAGCKPTTNFGACRDLNGRRLRHVNQQVAMEKWNKEKEGLEKKRKEGMSDKELEEMKTASGIAGWHLAVPAWAEGLKKAGKEHRRKTIMCSNWVNARKDNKPPKDAESWWGCPRGDRCDFAHGGDELHGAGLTEFKKNEKEKKFLKKDMEKQEYLAFDQHGHLESAVLKGLSKRGKMKKRKLNKSGVLGISSDGQPMAVSKVLDDITPLFGQVHIEEMNGTVEGVSDFGTATIFGCALQRGKWYYEAELLTDGVMQIGWANEGFEGSSDTGDGVGDHISSWSYDGVRCQKWNGESSNYGNAWKAGDIVGCFLDLDRFEISFSLNGEDMGVAFQMEHDASVNGYFPAFSLETEEKLKINLGRQAFRYPANKESIEFTPVALREQMNFTHADAEPEQGLDLKLNKVHEQGKDKNVQDVQEQVDVKSNADVEVSSNGQHMTTVKESSQVEAEKHQTTNATKITDEVYASKPKKLKKPETKIIPNPLALDSVNSVQDLIKLGPDRLKGALFALGMKCGYVWHI